MNTHQQSLADQLKANPRAFAEKDEELLREIILEYCDGNLTEVERAEVDALLQSDAHAKSILEDILAAERYADSPEGRASLMGLGDRVIAEAKAKAKAGCSESPPASPWAKFSRWARSVGKRLIPDPDDHDLVLAAADTSEESGFLAHQEVGTGVVSRLWQNEQGETVLSIMTEDVSLVAVAYRLDGGESGTILLETGTGPRYASVTLNEPIAVASKRTLSLSIPETQ